MEIQQRTIEYLQLSQIADADVLATVLEEMPSFAERESSILSSILQKKKPPSEMGREEKVDRGNDNEGNRSRAAVMNNNNNAHSDIPPVVHLQNSAPSNQSIDLLGI